MTANNDKPSFSPSPISNDGDFLNTSSSQANDCINEVANVQDEFDFSFGSMEEPNQISQIDDDKTSSDFKPPTQTTEPFNATPGRSEQAFLDDKKQYDNWKQQVFDEWLNTRREERARRNIWADVFFALIITLTFGAFAVVTWRLSRVPNAGAVEFLGLIGMVLTQLFGAFLVIVKYFFGAHPEDLDKIGRFFIESHPGQFPYGYSNDKKSSTYQHRQYRRRSGKSRDGRQKSFKAR